MNILQSLLTLGLLFLLLQVMVTSNYSPFVTVMLNIAGYCLAGGVLSFLSYKFFRWGSQTRNKTVILYGFTTQILST